MLRNIYKTDPFEEMPDAFAANIPHDVGTEEMLEAEEMQLLIEVAIGRMPETRRRVFELYRDGLNHDEISARLEMSDESVRQNLFRARKDIREIIALILFFLAV